MLLTHPAPLRHSRCRRAHIAALRPLLALISLLFLFALPTGCISTQERPTSHATEWTTIGRSLQHRPIQARTIGSGTYRVLIVGGIHGNEPEPAPSIDPICSLLINSPTNSTVLIIRDLNPDGTALKTRGNSRGVDLNRNWPASNFHPSPTNGPAPLSEPETALLHTELLAFNPDLIIVLHSIKSGPFVNFDGPAQTQAHTFAETARKTNPRWHVRPSMGYPTPGSLGTWAGLDRNIPILTIELQRPHPPNSPASPLPQSIHQLLPPQKQTKPPASPSDTRGPNPSPKIHQSGRGGSNSRHSAWERDRANSAQVPENKRKTPEPLTV